MAMQNKGEYPEKTLCRKAELCDLKKTSAQLTISYRATYEGVMAAEWLSSFMEDHWVSILQKTLADGGSCLVVENEQSILGSAVFGASVLPGCTGYAELFAIYLLPDAIGMGIGGMLYREAEQAMIEAGFCGCVLEVLQSNRRAIIFYYRQGFYSWGNFMLREGGRDLHCARMRKEFSIEP